MTSTGQGAAIDSAAATAFFEHNGDRATALPPVAIVIAAYNEEGVVGSVVDALPNTLCGLGTMAIVVSDGSKDGTVEEAGAHGALVCDVPVNRGQGAALPMASTTRPRWTRCWGRWWRVRPISSPDRASSAARRPRTWCAAWAPGCSREPSAC